MKFIEIAENLSIRIDEIEAIGKGESDLTSIVHTHHSLYNSTFPYDVLLQLLENELAEPINNTQQQQLNILKTQGYYAG